MEQTLQPKAPVLFTSCPSLSTSRTVRLPGCCTFSSQGCSVALLATRKSNSVKPALNPLSCLLWPTHCDLSIPVCLGLSKTTSPVLACPHLSWPRGSPLLSQDMPRVHSCNTSMPCPTTKLCLQHLLALEKALTWPPGPSHSTSHTACYIHWLPSQGMSWCCSHISSPVISSWTFNCLLVTLNPLPQAEAWTRSLLVCLERMHPPAPALLSRLDLSSSATLTSQPFPYCDLLWHSWSLLSFPLMISSRGLLTLH